MGFTMYFQPTKYQKNHFDTISAMSYFILMIYCCYVCGDFYMERSTMSESSFNAWCIWFLHEKCNEKCCSWFDIISLSNELNGFKTGSGDDQNAA